MQSLKNEVGSSKQKRLENEQKQMNFRKKKFNSDIIYCRPKLTEVGENLYHWEIKFKGKQGTALEGGYYDCDLRFDNTDYPIKPPEVKFQNNFKHMHVYEGGKICLPFVDTEWKSDSSNFDITNAIYNMIHGEPKPNDSANMTICEIYKKDPNQYYELLKAQAQEFQKYAPE